MHILENW